METFKFFGWVAGLKTSDIENRSDFLIKLLQLPGPERRVKELRLVNEYNICIKLSYMMKRVRVFFFCITSSYKHNNTLCSTKK